MWSLWGQFLAGLFAGWEDLLSEVLIRTLNRGGDVTPCFAISAEGTQPRLPSLTCSPPPPFRLSISSFLCCPATGAFPPLAPFPPRSASLHTFPSVTNIYRIALSAVLCAGHQGSSGEGGMSSALRALPLSLLCNNGQAGSGPSLRHPSLPSTTGLPPPSLSPTWHLAPLPCPDIPSGFCVSPARGTDGLSPFTPAFSCQPWNSAPLRSPVSQVGEEEERAQRVCRRADVRKGTNNLRWAVEC